MFLGEGLHAYIDGGIFAPYTFIPANREEYEAEVAFNEMF
jgi:hypothetical protein